MALKKGTTLLVVVLLAVSLFYFGRRTSENFLSDKFEVKYSHSFPADSLYLNTGQLRTIRVDNKSNWKVIYSQAARLIYLFDDNSEFRGVVGKQGRGPGEYQNVLGISFRDEYIIVNDQSLSKYLVFNYKGEYLKEQSYSNIGVNLIFNKPLIYIQDLIAKQNESDGVAFVSIYDVDSGEFVNSINTETNQDKPYDPVRERVLIESVRNSFYVLSQTENIVDEYSSDGGMAIGRHVLSGINFEEIKTKLSIAYSIPEPNIFLDFRVFGDLILLSLNGDYRQILIFDRKYNLVGSIDLAQHIEFAPGNTY